MISDVFYELDGIYIDDIEVVMFLIDETTSTIKLDQADFTFSQYPNPATSDFTIRTDLSELNFTSGKLEVFDLLGNRLYIQEIEPGQGDYTIPSATWPAGIYTSVLSIDGSRIRTGKVVIVQ